MKYKKAILGGTFDRFHVGHQKLIDTAFAESEQVTIGITTEKLYQHKFLSETIEGYAIREQAVKKYLTDKGDSNFTIIPIDTIYGTTLEDKAIDAIFVTEENLANVALINKKRSELVFPPLAVIVVPYVQGNDGERVTSERIRAGEIDRKGTSYFHIFSRVEGLTLPDNFRDDLRKPLGHIVAETSEVLPQLQKRIVITVGDIVTQSLIDADHTPDISIIDFKTRRHTIASDHISVTQRIVNPAGTIQQKAVAAYLHQVKRYLEKREKQTLIIDGEEDLLALPAILLAPLESIVLYGQYDQGVVINKVTEKKKHDIVELLKHFV